MTALLAILSIAGLIGLCIWWMNRPLRHTGRDFEAVKRNLWALVYQDFHGTALLITNESNGVLLQLVKNESPLASIHFYFPDIPENAGMLASLEQATRPYGADFRMAGARPQRYLFVEIENDLKVVCQFVLAALKAIGSDGGTKFTISFQNPQQKDSEFNPERYAADLATLSEIRF